MTTVFLLSGISSGRFATWKKALTSNISQFLMKEKTGAEDSVFRKSIKQSVYIYKPS